MFVHLNLVYSWDNIADVWPTLSQHRFNISSLLEKFFVNSFFKNYQLIILILTPVVRDPMHIQKTHLFLDAPLLVSLRP